ncbi:major facilitator superfamily domain-containing protein [Lentinula lateritia]|nr:major facilitator superfamily domain-containing protein [Lentinula lateritia]
MSEVAPAAKKHSSTISIEKITDGGHGEESLSTDLVSESELKRIQRKIDLRIMPWICLTYMFMRLNVNTVGNIAIVNAEQKHDIKTQLHLSPPQWAWVISCFYYTYMGREQTKFLDFTYHVLGAAEGGFFPCILYYLAFWFRPEEITLRICFMLACSTFSGIITTSVNLFQSSGFISYGVAFADGHGHLAGWRWLFIIEGLPPIVLGLFTIFVLPDYPDSKATANATWNTRQAIDVLWNPTFWSFAGIWVGNALGNPTPSFVLPTVIFELVQIINLICCVILMTVKQPIVRYVFILIARSASNTVVNILWPSRVAALKGTTAVGLGIALSNVLSNIDGLIGPLIFSIGIISIAVTGALVGRPVFRPLKALNPRHVE